MAKAVITFTVRPDTRVQIENHRRAARTRRWSLNRFYLEAADKMTAETVGTSSLVRATDGQPQPTLS